MENYWAPGVSGYGAHVSRPGVQNYIVRGDHPAIGVVDLSRSNHVHVMEWYYYTIACPSMKCGFQNSVFAHCCGRTGSNGLDGLPVEPEPAIETALGPPVFKDDQMAVFDLKRTGGAKPPR